MSCERALELAYAYVNRRERTVAEVHAQLERKGISESNAEAAIAELVDTHVLDDERFAEMFVTDKRELEAWGSERIRRGLVARGIERELAERALALADRAGASPDGIGDDDRDAGETVLTDHDRALALLRRRFPHPPRDRRERDRALGVLLRKGYESELAVDALAAYAHELDA